MKTRNRTKSRLLSALLALCMIMSMLPLSALPALAAEPGTLPATKIDPLSVVPLTITSGLNKDVIADKGDEWKREGDDVYWGSEYSYEVDSLEQIENNVFFAENLYLSEAIVGGMESIIQSDATPGLYWRRPDLSGNTAVQLPRSNSPTTIKFSNTDFLSSLFFLYATCYGAADTKLNVTVKYEDGTSTSKVLDAPNWYSTAGTVATARYTYINGAKTGIDPYINYDNPPGVLKGSTTAAPYLHQGEVLVDASKIIKEVAVNCTSSNTNSIINILAVSGISSKYVAFDTSSAANKDAVFEVVKRDGDTEQWVSGSLDYVETPGNVINGERYFFSSEFGVNSSGFQSYITSESGLPANNVIFSQATDGLFFKLNEYNQNNIIQLKNSENATITAPVGFYEKLYFLFTTGNAASDSKMSVTVKYKDDSTTQKDITTPDMSSSSGTVASNAYATTLGGINQGDPIYSEGRRYREFYTISANTNYMSGTTQSPNLHQAEIEIDKNKQISDITVAFSSSNANTKLNIMGLSAKVNESFTNDGYYYSENNGEITIVGYKGNETYITIPSSINGKPVVKIGDHAFASNKNITEVIIPLSVTEIGNNAFNACSALEAVTIPGSVKIIGAAAFENCKALTYLSLSEGLETIGNSAFRYCDSLKTVSMPNSVTRIEAVAFRNCVSLENVILSRGLKGRLSNGIFDGCRKLKSIVIPEGITVIGERVFQYCSSMTTVVIPNSVKEINNIAFNDCTALKTAEFYGTKEEMAGINITPNGNDKLIAVLRAMRKSDEENSFIHVNAEDDFPEDTEAAKGLNPLGQKADRPFLIVEQNEFFFYRSYQNSGGYVSRHDQYNFDPTKDLSYSDGQYFSDVEAPTSKVITGVEGSQEAALTMLAKPDMAYVEAVSYDPYGTGRKDHVAYVGIVGSGSDDGKIWMWVENSKGEMVGWHNPKITIDWMKSGKDLERFKAQNYMSITAGDYDGDGRETFVIYIPNYKDSDGVHIGAVHEYTLEENYGSSASGSPTSVVKWLTNINVDQLTSYTNTKTEDGKLIYRHDPAADMDDLRFEPQVSLASGDFDGDGRDELATSVSMGVCGDIANGWSADGNNRTTLGNYMTTVNIIPKNSNNKYFNTSGKYTKEVYSLDSVISSDNTKTKGKYYGLYSGQLCVGDTTGAGRDDLVVVGYTGSFTMNVMKNNGSMQDFSHLQDLDQNSFGYATIMYNGNGGYNCSSVGTENYNKFTQTGTAMYFDGENGVHTPLAVASAKMEGANAADTFFISGTLYKLDSGKLQKVFTLGFFNRSFKTVHNEGVTNYFVDNVTSGNFDHDEGGREEFYFSYMFKDVPVAWRSDHYCGHSGIIGGVYDDAVSEGSIKTFGALSNYYSTGINESNLTFMDNEGRFVNMIPICVDIDNDGILGKYESTQYIYADPTVEVVLQAAPYYGELEDYGECGGETSYTVTVGNTKGTTEGHSNSFSAMVNTEFALGSTGGIGGIELSASLSAGYSLEHNSGFDDAYSTEYSTSFTAGPYDTVVVQRLPVQLYNYRIFDSSKNAWSDECYTLQSIRKPVYYQYSISDYNELVDQYNNLLYENVQDGANNVITRNMNRNGVNIKDLSKRELINQIGLKKITNADLPGDTTGKPQNYWNSWAMAGEGAKKLSDYTIGLGMNGGSTEVEWSASEEHGYSYELSHGFSFEASVMISKGSAIGSAGIGIGISYNHSVSSGYYYSNSSGTSASGSVANINLPGLAALGLPEQTVRDYGFNWEFGTWTRNLGSIKSDDSGQTQFFGYIVKDITMPSVAVDDLEARYILNVDNNKLTADLTWTKPNNGLGRAAIKGYNVYSIENGKYKLLNQTPITSLGYSVDLLEREKDYTFVVTTVYNDFGGGTSLWSNEAVLYAENAPSIPMRSFHVVGANMTFTASGNKLGVSMDGRRGTCLEGTVVSFTAAANPGYKIKGYQIGTADAVTLPEKQDSYQMNVTVNADELDIVFITEYVGAGSSSEGSPQIVLQNASGHAGQSVAVDVKLSNNPGVAFVRFGLTYDRNVLELSSVSNGVLFTSMSSGAMQVFVSSDNITADGVLATLKFKVKSGTAPNTYDIGFNYCEAYDKDENTVAFTAVPGTIEVRNPLDIKYGDVNGDGSVNGRDSVLLLRYLANYADGVLIGDTEVIIAAGADANGDGTVNGKDATRLLSYLANYDNDGNLVEGGVEVKLGPAA